MSNFKYGCETFSWVMSGDKYVGDCGHICEIVKRAGLSGIETNGGMMGRYFEDPALMADLLEVHDLQLASLSFGGGFRGSTLSEREREQADKVFDYLKSFPQPRITLAHGSRDRSDLGERQRNAMACINEVARHAADRGISCAFHPTSGGYSIFRTADDYKLMLDSLDTSVVGYCPDSGHIVNGEMDVYEIFATYASVIGHVHLKDINEDRSWAPMGEGIIDFPRLLKTLHDAGYDGWIDIEEESADARVDPDAATLKNGRYLAETLLPLGF
ncbi:MAG: sugar phosphate isomerase/epimerase family protein [Pseudomonadales bacterium]|nr:sugar phosphate isomerase/epimerase family protein [Pseudomonadales bacterium]HJN51701.1 sugar phosphate isomerase/epimerase family protein [Pseudomonadales bacterium]